VTIEHAARLARVEARDRLGNLAILTAAGVVWLLVLLILFTRDPIEDASARFVGAALIGLAVGLTAIPLAWLIAFARHRRIAYRGDWTRAVRRGASSPATPRPSPTHPSAPASRRAPLCSSRRPVLCIDMSALPSGRAVGARRDDREQGVCPGLSCGARPGRLGR